MFMVLAVHANYWSLGTPSALDYQIAPLPSYTRTFLEAISVPCVNIFVLISGWFGIKRKVKGLLGFLFQCLFFNIIIYVAFVLSGLNRLDFEHIQACFLLRQHQWFIKSYLLLYLLAPVLNAYIDNSKEQSLRMTIAGFLAFQTIFGWLLPAVPFFHQGTSTISFIGLYLLAQYCRRYPNRFLTLSKKWDLTILIVTAIMITLLGSFNLPILKEAVFSYVSPLVIIFSLYTLLLFSKINSTSKVVNYIAASSFAVYLLHSNYSVADSIFKHYINLIYEHFDGITCLSIITLFLILIYSTAIFIDQIRKYLWSVIVSYIH